MTKTVRITKPHLAQEKILNARKRFNVVACGRRFGKTTLVEYLISEKAHTGLPIGYFSPTYKLQDQVWREFKFTFEPIIKKKNEVTRSAQLMGGSWIEFWSLEDENAGRSRKYCRVIIDEAGMTDSDRLEAAWLQSIRPTLMDYKGDAYLMSSPSDVEHFFHKLFQRGPDPKFKSYRSFQFPTWSNPYISKREIEEMRLEYVGDEKRFDREVGAKFLRLGGDLFFSCFDDSINAKPSFYNADFPYLWIKFDFNAKSTAVISQHYKYHEAVHYDIFPNKEKGGIMDIEVLHDELDNLCSHIAEKYGDKHKLIITGDSSGDNATAYVITLFEIIRQKLVEYTFQFHGCAVKLDFDIPNGKLPYVVSRQCANVVMDYYGENYICDPMKCKMLIDDFNRCKTSNTGGLDKVDMNKKDYGHAADAWRYGNERFEQEIILGRGIKM